MCKEQKSNAFAKFCLENDMIDWSDFVQQVKRANDIVDVIGSYLDLRRSGTTFFARCPFHGEKTASFAVNRDRQIYHCFGCGEGGDVIKFVQQYESCTRMEALEMLAKRANIPMPETSRARNDADYERRKKQRDTYMQILRDAAVFYYKTYHGERGKIARDYMTGRGFNLDTVKKFGIGYSPDGYSLINALEHKYKREDLLGSGVAKESKNGNLYDALAGRLIVPIFNMQGKVIAFGGRGLDERTVGQGKYKNTSETPLFHKQDNLFAINFAKQEKQQAALPNIVIVEGYMDVISMYQAGFRRAVASMGTSLTQNQAKWLSRLTSQIYVCYDGDAAGQKATVRGMDILDKAGLEVKVMSVPENMDPDEYIQKYGAQAFEKLIEQALPLPDYKLELLDEAFPLDTADAVKRNEYLPKYVNGAISMLKQLDDVRQAQYVKAVSLKTGYSEDFLRRKLAGIAVAEEEAAQKPTEQQPSAPETAEIKAKYFVAACLLAGESYASWDEMPICETPFLKQLFDYLQQSYQKGEIPSADMIYTVCPDASKAEYNAVLGIDLSPKKQAINKACYAECKKLIEVQRLKQQRNDLLAEIKQHPERTDLLSALAEITSKINA